MAHFAIAIRVHPAFSGKYDQRCHTVVVVVVVVAAMIMLLDAKYSS